MVNVSKIKEIITRINDVIQDNKDYLTELDQPIGDSDHGINMARGFSKVMEKLDTTSNEDVGAVLKYVGMTLVSTVGGASGPLYGTAFMRMGAAASGKSEISKEDFKELLSAAIEGIKMRGKGTVGEKTMLDTLCPALDAFTKALEEGSDGITAIDKAIEAGEAGREYTKGIIATKGRASYLGERGIGHIDPGATSSLYMLQSIKNCL